MIDLPVARPSLTQLERAYVLDALESGWISGSGPYVERFEQEWASRCGTAHAVAVSNGTAALHLLLLADGVGAGDEVIVPALTYVAVANAVRHVGGVPIVVDVDPATWCIDPGAIANAITSRTVGIIGVHAYGHPADMPGAEAVARRHGLWLLEDGAQAHLATIDGRPVGGLADGAAFSFYGNKVVTTGEGGAITVNDGMLSAKLRGLRHQGVVGDQDDRFRPSLIGHNFRMTNISCAIGCAQLERIDEIVGRRRRIASAYDRGFCASVGVGAQPVAPWAVPSPWLYSVTMEGGSGARDRAAAELSAAGIETRLLFPPLQTLPVAQPARHPCPVAAALSQKGLSLPLFPDLAMHDVARIVDIVVHNAGWRSNR